MSHNRVGIIYDSTRVERYHVYLFVFDISRGTAAWLSPLLLGEPIPGVWHTSVALYSTEHFYTSQGVIKCAAGKSPFGQPDYVLYLGSAHTSKCLINQFLSSHRDALFAPKNYRFLSHNCNSFSQYFLDWLLGASVPEFVRNQLHRIRDTPFGPIWLSFIESFSA